MRVSVAHSDRYVLLVPGALDSLPTCCRGGHEQTVWSRPPQADHGRLSVRPISLRVMTIVLPIDPEGESPEDPLEVIGFEDVSVPIEHPARARTEVRVTFALSRPPSAREVLLVDQRNWRWGMSEGAARLRVDGYRIGDIAQSLALVKARLSEISQQARQLDLRDAETLRTVLEKLRAELPEV